MATALFTRWFQLQVFSKNPRLRLDVAPGNACAAPDPRQRVLVNFIELRRRLEPYMASCGAEAVTSGKPGAGRKLPPKSGGDDFTSFSRAGGKAPAFSFGSALWVCPAPADATEDNMLRIPLPAGTGWIDFWSGASYAGGDTIQAPAPLDRMPLFARAGAIIPLAALRDADRPSVPPEGDAPLEVRVYPGANGSLALHESTSGKAPALIPFTWNDRARELWIGPRTGATTGPMTTVPRRFEIVLVGPGRGVGFGAASRANFSVVYEGRETRLRMPEPPARPSPPIGLSARLEAGRVFFTWQELGEDVIYRFKRIGPTGNIEDLASALLSPAFSMVAPTGVACPSMRCVVTALNAGGESEPSAPVDIAAATRLKAPQAQRLPHVAGLHQTASAARPGATGLSAPSTLRNASIFV